MTRAPRWSKDLEEAARERMRRDGGVHYDDAEPPQLEVVATSAAHVEFLAHRYVYTTPWTGSDWANHYILRGRARLEGTHAVDIQLEPHYIHLTEVETDDYQGDEVVRLLATGDITGADAAVARMKAATEARVKAACGEAAARAEPAQPAPTSRCPRCRSTDAGVKDVIFDVIVMRCNACSLEEHIDTWDRDSWAP